MKSNRDMNVIEIADVLEYSIEECIATIKSLYSDIDNPNQNTYLSPKQVAELDIRLNRGI